MSISKEFKIGLLVTIAAVILYFGFSFLKGKALLSTDQTFYIVYDNLGGLTKANTVTINGSVVGRVADIKMKDKLGDQFVVTISVQDELAVTKGAVAVLTSPSPIASMEIQLKQSAATEYHVSGDTLYGETGGGLTDLMEDKIFPAIKSLENVLGNVDSVFNDQAQKKIQSMLNNLDGATAQLKSALTTTNGILKHNQPKINAIMTNSQAATAQLKQTLADAQETMASVKKAAGQLGEVDFKQMNEKLQGILANLQTFSTQLNSKEGSIGKMINTPDIHNSLQDAIDNMNFLVADMQANPHRYVNINVFGKKPVDSDIIKRVRPKKLGNDNKLTIDLKLNVPADLELYFYELQSKDKVTLTKGTHWNELSTTTIEVTLPGTVTIGEHALGLEWNKGKDSDYASVVKD